MLTDKEERALKRIVHSINNGHTDPQKEMDEHWLRVFTAAALQGLLASPYDMPFESVSKKAVEHARLVMEELKDGN